MPSGHRDLLDRPPPMNRGPSFERVDEVKSGLRALDRTIKSLSREGSTLKADLDEFERQRSPRELAGVDAKTWANMRNMPMREIARLNGTTKPETMETEQYSSAATGVAKPAASLQKKTMREIAAEAKQAEAARVEAERERLRGLRARSGAKAKSAGKLEFLAAWDDRYADDAERLEAERRDRQREVDLARAEAARALHVSEAQRRPEADAAADGRGVPLSGMDLALSKLAQLDLALDASEAEKRVEHASAAAADAERAVQRQRKPRRAAAVAAQRGFAELLGQATRTHGGLDWADRTLPVLEGALELLRRSGEDGADRPADDSLEKMKPSAAFLALHELVTRRRAGDAAHPRGEFETVPQAALRVQTQANTPSLILPRARTESDEHFKLRLGCFKPRPVRGRAGTKPPLATFVLPMQADERPKDFEARMTLQELTPFPILPRDTNESLADFNSRLEAVGEARLLWLEHSGTPPPLLLPRGTNESEQIFALRLEHASTPPELGTFANAFCSVYLPQSDGEADAMARARILAQARSKASVLPFNPALETEDEFYARVPRAA